MPCGSAERISNSVVTEWMAFLCPYPGVLLRALETQLSLGARLAAQPVRAQSFRGADTPWLDSILNTISCQIRAVA